MDLRLPEHDQRANATTVREGSCGMTLLTTTLPLAGLIAAAALSVPGLLLTRSRR
ncbi:hypothetical protein [Actinomadura sp. 9N407]|uniref:hypothetical protein n=1 Tax=Actinomadura sp. 9N407 TaxID=3375154 RepID=UPI0037A5249E